MAARNKLTCDGFDFSYIAQIEFSGVVSRSCSTLNVAHNELNPNMSFTFLYSTDQKSFFPFRKKTDT